MSDDDANQIEVPASFQAVYTVRDRLTRKGDALRARYEVCEDLAQQLIETAQHLHHDLGVSQDEVLRRMLTGLVTPEAGFEPGEPAWLLQRLAELLGWAWPGLDELAAPG
ncbi:MAG: hypothetical protein AB9M60_07530 [Leptothrix sp. (in: b-proteobacteria)]